MEISRGGRDSGSVEAYNRGYMGLVSWMLVRSISFWAYTTSRHITVPEPWTVTTYASHAL